MKIPEQVPFMVLSGVTLFPQALLPLYIFEPRYRDMLETCLEGDRIFGVVSFDHAIAEKTASLQHHVIAGVGMVRACVGQEDGTSNLILQGLQRVQLVNYVRTKPYLVAEVRPLETFNTDNVEVDALSDKLLEVIHDFQERGHRIPPMVMDYLDRTKDTDALSDIVSYLLIKKPSFRQDILETLDLKARYRKLLKMVPEELAAMEQDKLENPIKKSSKKKKQKQMPPGDPPFSNN